MRHGVPGTRGVVLLVACGLTLTLGACSKDAPSPQPAAQSLASGLSSGDLSAVPLSGATPQAATAELSSVVTGMKAARRTVRVGEVTTRDDDRAASARLTVTWDVDASPTDWSYETAVELVRPEEAWQVVWNPAAIHPELGPGDRLSLRRTIPPRAPILGAQDAVLVTNRPVRRAGIDKTKVAPALAPRSAAALAAVVGVDPAAYAKDVQAAGARAFVEAIILRAASAVPLAARIAAIPGAVLLADELPLAPSRQFARPILGTVGEATAEIVAASDGALVAGDRAGLSGLQKRYDEQLRGAPGLAVRLVPAVGGSAESRVVFERKATPGTALTTTLDLAAQQRAEALLAGVRPTSALVAIRPSTGEVIAAASGPATAASATATVGRYPPGSTFKIVSTLALLRGGLTPSSPVPCTPAVVADGKRFGNYSDYPASEIGRIPFTDALAYSCNTAFISQRGRAPQAALARAAASLGLGVDRDLGLPAFFGSVPTAASDVEHAASMIGQGRIEASPLAVATVAASVAAGRTVVPHMVVRPDAPADAAPAPPPLTAAETAALRAMMRAVVQRGSGRQLADLPGAVGAKTGTAEFGAATPRRTHGWMVAFAGDLAVAVFVAEAESGSRTAGPVLKAFLQTVR